MTHREEKLLISWAGAPKPVPVLRSSPAAVTHARIAQKHCLLPGWGVRVTSVLNHTVGGTTTVFPTPPASSATAGSSHSHMSIGAQLVQKTEKLF